MFGEILHGIFNEVVGDDPQNRRIAGLPFNAVSGVATLDLGAQALDFDFSL